MNKEDKIMDKINKNLKIIDDLLMENGFYKYINKIVTIEDNISQLYDDYKLLQQENKELHNKIDKAIELNREIDRSLRMKNTNAYIQLEDLIFEQWKMLKKDGNNERI